MSLNLSSPRGDVADAGFERCRIAYHFVQHADNIRELWPGISVFLPAVQHQLVQHDWAVHRRREPEVLLYGIYHLVEREQEKHEICVCCDKIHPL